MSTGTINALFKEICKYDLMTTVPVVPMGLTTYR